MLGSAVVFAGCAGEEDDIFSDSAANRLTEGAKTAAEKLESSPAGWAMEYYPTTGTEYPTGNGYLLLTDFNSDGSTTVAMNNVFSSNAFKEDKSAWEVITDNGVVLTYNTYNQCMHAFSNPEDLPFTTESNEDELGTGAGGDYEFMLVDVPDDEQPEYIMLKGKKRGTYIRLSRLEDGTDFKTYLDDVQAFNSKMFPSSAPNDLKLTFGDSIMRVASMSSGIPNIYPWGTDAIANESFHPYLITKHNGKYMLRFRDALTASDGSKVQEFAYDETQDLFADINNPSNVLQGLDMAEFLLEKVNAGNYWQIRSTSEMSEASKTLYDNINSEFKKLSNRTLQYIRIMKQGEDFVFGFNYRESNGRNGTAFFKITLEGTGDNLTTSYVEPLNTASQNILNSVPSIGTFLTDFSGSITLSAYTTRFNLSSIRLTGTDANVWFVFSLI